MEKMKSTWNKSQRGKHLERTKGIAIRKKNKKATMACRTLDEACGSQYEACGSQEEPCESQEEDTEWILIQEFDIFL